MSKNLIEALQDELRRNRELVKIYKSIGPAGSFGATMIQSDMDEAEKAMAAGDVAFMIAWLKRLRENEA